MENLHLLTGNSKAESHKLTRSEARRGVIYTGDSRTSNWRKRKIQSKAAEGCQSMTVFFQVSEKTISEEQTA
jgi:hypothetical protein